MAPIVAVAVAKSVIFTVAVAPLVSPVIVVSLANIPVELLKVKIFLSLSNDTTVAVTTLESEAIPVTVSEVEKLPDKFKTKIFFLKVNVGGLGDN